MAGRAIDEAKEETRIPATKRAEPIREMLRKAETADMVVVVCRKEVKKRKGGQRGQISGLT